MSTYHITAPTQLDCLLLPCFENEIKASVFQTLSPETYALVESAVTAKDFEGKPLQTLFLYTQDQLAPRILLIGLGKQKELTIRRWKQAVGVGIIGAQTKKVESIGLALPKEVIQSFSSERIGQETVIAMEAAAYAFDLHKSDPSARVKKIAEVFFLGLSSGERRRYTLGMERGEKIAASMQLVRELGNTPPSVMTPSYLARHAIDVAKQFSKTVKTTVYGRAEIKKLGMGCLLGVASGSTHEPKFIIVEYRGAGKKDMPTVLIGKGITFDSGGLSLKPAAAMNEMKFDMLGAATALGVVRAAAALGLKKNCIALIPSCENMPDGESYRPDDILINMEGVSVEVQNTDAEGRLILCEALSYAKKYNPKEVIDFATLTGACVVALGNERSGLFTPDDRLRDKLLVAAAEVGEQLWHLPLGEEYSESIQSTVADIANIGCGVGGERYGGASTAAAFLEHFTRDKKTKEPCYVWAHVDLSSSYYGGKGKPWIRGGANGFGLETLVTYLA